MTSTEYVSYGRPPRVGPEMPEKRMEHCMVKLDKSMALLTGGSDVVKARNSVWIYSIEDEEWFLGNNLKFQRTKHSCGVLTDSKYDLTRLLICFFFCLCIYVM